MGVRAEEVVAREEEAMSAAKMSARDFLIFFFIFSVLSFFYGCFSAESSLVFSSIVSSFVFWDFVFCTLKKTLSRLTFKILIRFFYILFVSFLGGKQLLICCYLGEMVQNNIS